MAQPWVSRAMPKIYLTHLVSCRRNNMPFEMILKLQAPEGVELTGEVSPEAAAILTPDALALVARLHREFNARRFDLLRQRVKRQSELDEGRLPDFLSETRPIRQ